MVVVWQRPADCILVVEIEVIWGIWPGVAGMDQLTSGIVTSVFIWYLWMGYMIRSDVLRFRMYGAGDSSRSQRKTVFGILKKRFRFGY